MNMHILDQQLQEILKLPPYQIQSLHKARISSVRDLLMCLPVTYVDVSSPTSIAKLVPDKHTVVVGTIKSIAVKKMFPKNMLISEAIISDNTGVIRSIWFSRVNATRYKTGDEVQITGKVHKNKRGLFFTNPIIKHANNVENSTTSLNAIYPRVRGISPHQLQVWQEQVLSSLPAKLSDTLPVYIRKKFNLPSLFNAVQYVHKPPTAVWANAAQKRFAFEEMFIVQLHRLQQRHILKNTQARQITTIGLQKELTDTLPFTLTNAQTRAVTQILSDLSRSYPMARLLEGDVGSGKTLVAIVASFAAIRAGYQVAYLAPTEILARQHFAEFINRLSPFRPTIGLMTSAECKSFPSKLNQTEATHIARSQLLTWMRVGKLSLLIGTHALLEKQVTFNNLALAIIDEQHRFGTQQRASLMAHRSLNDHAASVPHLLSMTATPIPRTLALTLYGDLDVSLLDELPPGRKQPVTHIVPPHKRAAAYEFIRENIKAGGQAFVICPKIEKNTDEAEEIQPPEGNRTSINLKTVKSVTEEYEYLQKNVFPELSIAMLHGKLPARGKSTLDGKPSKESVIQAFRDKKIDILVSTSVIEVGMDIPNASVMMIEGAEYFGLASLHQFRGRVGRAGQQAYCFVFTESKNKKTHERLHALAKAKDGFQLAEHDLQLRGAGELTGNSQWGISDIGMEALQNLKMVEAAREEAKKLIERDPELRQYPELRDRVEKLEEKGLHME